ncbi:SusC/RagA family TonB-linked outer membrane protein [Flavobacterium wongokense]|uniref:SusC/RagA family TonB-linked outer membrane protein n=1 Tax=Flavobacterium wongokense TaxID=2910674 RepID=UPI001F2575E5|nr:SusC/RagA family TonB-linked outer membrane protein [Flavobacterium sp. WG47]MCF6133076.1 SusC/RagA family TonB-linked outer membrane protein [Flavobacterium sp. WG47]
MKTKLNGFLTLFIALLVQISFAQDRVVSGVVSDNSGLPLPGVNVLVKGTAMGTQTDIDGKYSIKAEATQTLVFNFVGMKSQEVSAASTTVNVTMKEDAVELEGVVVTALGVKRDKKSLGYATQEVKAADLKSGTAGGNFINDLSGKVAGVQVRRNNNFGGSTNLVSRGVKSLTGNNQMLIVVDGVPVNNSNTNSKAQTNGRGTTFDYGNTATDINPEDIESVNVLKGAAASALYGYQAGNGVLMITTKKGKAGKKGLGVTFTTEAVVGSIDKSTFIEYQKKYGAGYGLYYGPDEDAYFNQDDIDGDGTQDLLVPFYEDASFGAPFDGQMVYQWDAFTPYSPNFGQKTEWRAAKNGPIEFFETPLSLNNSISLEDGNEKSNFVFNYSNLKQTGLMPNSEIKKNNFSIKLNHNLTDRFTLSVFANYNVQKAVGRNSTGYNDNIMSNFRQWWQTNVDIKSQQQVYNASGGQNVTWNIKSPTDLSPAYWDNPYFQRYQNYQNDSRDRFLGYAKLDYKVNNWLTATARISTDTYSEIQEERRAIGSVAAEFGVPNADNVRFDQGSGYQRFNKTYRENNYDLIFNFKKDFGKINLTGLLGGSINRIDNNSIFASTNGGLIVPGVYSLLNSQQPISDPLELRVPEGINSYYGQVSFGYDDFLFLDGTVRRDAYSTLPEDDNVSTYPSISGSLLFSNLIKQSWLSFGKFRLNWAQVGNGAPAQSLADSYAKFPAFDGNGLFSVNSIKNNPDLRPTVTSSYEAGLEMQMFDRRFGFDISYYRSLSDDQIFRVPYSEATGITSRLVNAGSIENKGIELQLNGTPVKTANFQWDINVNWARNRNEVVSLADGIDNLQLGSFQGGVTINASVGQPYGIIKGSDFTYLNGEKIVGANGRYVLNNSSNNNIGDINPDWTGGVRNKFTYKDFAFSFLIDMQKGGDIFSLDRYYGLATGLPNETAELNDLGNPIRNPITGGPDSGGIILPGVFADGTPNDVRAPGPEFFGNSYGYRRQPNRAFVYDASYIKLREVSISYSFPKKWVDSLKLENMKFSLVGTNLWIIHKNLPDADPESGLGSGNLSSGYSVGSLPTTRNIGCNLTLKF